jgi:uncharacterized membrane protein YfcA
VWWILAGGTFAVAVVAAMLGQGGGVLYTPLQVWLGIDFHRAATTSLFLIMATSVAASLVFSRAKRIDWPLAISLEAVDAVGGLAGGLASDWLSGTILSLIFAAVTLTAATFMVLPTNERESSGDGRGGLLVWKRTLGDRSYCVDMALALPLSVVAGVLSGMVGVGGGLIKVPLMVLLLGVPMEIAVGSSAMMVGLTASGGFFGHVLRGHWDWKLSLVLAVVVFVGGQIGSRLTVKLDDRKLRGAFGAFLVVVAATMVFEALS